MRFGLRCLCVLSLVPTLAWAQADAGVPELDVMATRDQRLLQATATDPPPIEQRVAMDGLFVVPLRAVLDQAPRPVSQVARAGHA